MKTWKVTKLGPNQLGIECPNRDCRGKARVSRAKWLTLMSNYTGRSCTYCFRASQIPKEYL